MNTSEIRISLCGRGALHFRELLDESSIPYRTIRFPTGTIVASADTVVITAAVISAVGSIISAWITSRNSRSASVTYINNTFTEINVSMTIPEIQQILESAETVTVFDTDPPAS